MGLMEISETIEHLGNKQPLLTNEEKEFVVQFAFKSGDKELTTKLIDELVVPDADKELVIQKFTTMIGLKPKWIEQIENLLVAIEMYRVEEQKALNHLVEVLTAYGIDVSIDEIRNADVESIKEKVQSERTL